MLRVISINDFKNMIEDIKEVDSENISILNSHRRVLAMNVNSRRNIPGFKRSAVDGYAVKAEDTYLCSETIPAILSLKETIEIGKEPNIHINFMECSYVPTGGMIPSGANSVVKIEDCEVLNNDILVNKSVGEFENIVRENDDITKGDVVLTKGDTILSTHIAVLASLGLSTVKVKKQIKVGIISTGDELLGIDDEIKVPKIKDTNGPFLKFACEEDGCISKYYGILKDDENNILCNIKKALEENDIIFLSGGSSVGKKDFTEKVMRQLGDIMFHGIAVKPGKPTLMARCKNNKYIVGFPGHPMACTIVYKFIISKFINKLYGRNLKKVYNILEFGENYHKSIGREEYLPVSVIDDIPYPIYAKSSALSTMARCDGIIKIDRNIEGIRKGEKVKVMR